MLPVQTFSNQVLEQLAGASIRSACLAALVIVLIALLRLRSAALQHAIWAVVLVSMLVMPVASVVVPPLRLPVAFTEDVNRH